MTHNYRISCDCCYTCKLCDWGFTEKDKSPRLRLYCRPHAMGIDPHYICDDYVAEQWHLNDKKKIVDQRAKKASKSPSKP